ncbi:MAG: GYF domain-containing protein [Verrucomicrobiales bacterium]|jgi:hypothetical protein|nr:GYF domain-containing protein [Verrucomicrobiales bacterium]
MKQWYYAINGQQSGPFQKSHVAELYRKGELADRDLVWEEGTPKWIAAGKVFGSLTVTPPPAAKNAVPVTGSGAFKVFACLQRGWDLVWKHPAHLIGGFFLAGVIAFVISASMNLSPLLTNANLAEKLHYQLTPPMRVLGLQLHFGGMILNLFVSPPLYAGMFWMLLETLRGKAPDLGNLLFAFKDFKLALKVIVANLLVGLVITVSAFITGIFSGVLAAVLATLIGAGSGVGGVLISLVIFIILIPVIYFGVAYLFTGIALVDRRLGIWEAMEFSRKIVTRRWWSMFGLMLLNLLVMLLGLLACGVGLIVSAPVAAAGLMYAYHSLAAEWEQEHRP